MTKNEEVKLINLTPHTINIIVGGETVSIPPSGTVARIGTSEEECGFVVYNGIEIPIVQTYFSCIDMNLPDEEPGVFYIVSRLVRENYNDYSHYGRSDLLVPGPLVRDEKGQPIGCLGLSI